MISDSKLSPSSLDVQEEKSVHFPHLAAKLTALDVHVFLSSN
jgi:hypothetical protein